MKADSVRTIFYALGANLAIAVAKTGAAITTGSSAMLAEAIHSYADSGNQGLLLLGMKQAKRPPSAEYPLGWGKAVFFWSFIVALVLFSLGGLFSVYEGWHKLAHPEDLSYPWVAVGILVFGLAAETVSLRACLHEVNKVRGGRTLWRWFRESRQSELVVILGEDIAALLGPGVRPGRDPDHDAHRQPGLGCARLDLDRRAADRGRDRHRHRDQGAAHRPERRARDRGSACASSCSGTAKRRKDLPHHHAAARHAR